MPNFISLMAVIDDRTIRFEGLFSPYDLRVIFSDYEEALVGSGSFSYARQIDSFRYPGVPNPSVIVGRHCEIASGAVVLAGGEHQNDRVVNVTFQRFVDVAAAKPNLRQLFRAESKGETRIGNGVVISRNVVVRSGVCIGNGAVIGANSVVTSDIPPYAIAAGAPARVLRYRFDERQIEAIESIRWWDFDVVWIFSNLGLLSQESPDKFISAINKTTPKYRADSARFVFDASATVDAKRSFLPTGVDVDGKFFCIDQCPKEIQDYVKQIGAPNGQKISFIKNIFDAL